MANFEGDYYHNLQVRHPLSYIIDKRGWRIYELLYYRWLCVEKGIPCWLQAWLCQKSENLPEMAV